MDISHYIELFAKQKHTYEPYDGICKNVLLGGKAYSLNMQSGPESGIPFRTVLEGLLTGCTARDFAGSGFEATEGMLNAMKIFASADTTTFLEKYPDICPAFEELYTKYVKMIQEKVSEGSWKAGFGNEYIDQAREVLALLN